MNRYVLVLSASLLAASAWGARKPKAPDPTPLDRYVEEALARGASAAGAAPGSLFSPASRFADLSSDVRAAQVDDIVTILVAERASAVAKGTLKTARQSDAKSNISALAGITRAAGPLANLAGLSTETKLNGEGATSRETVLTTTLTARVTHVLPNGYLVLEAAKDTQVNAERQLVTVRGVARPADLGPGNTVRSDRLAQMEVRINGKGVVADAVRRPFFLYRLLLGILPF